VIIREKQIRTRALDIGFILDQVEKIDRGLILSNLNGRLDLNNIASGGHSYGGATTVLASHNDKRIKACLVLDGWISPVPDSVVSAGLGVPLLFMGRPDWNSSDYPTNYERLDDLMAHSSNSKYQLRIRETLHLDYTDIPLMSPLIKYVMDVGSLNPGTSLSLINELSHGFLEWHLLQRDNGALDQALKNKLIIRI
jgi:hypothetical protein